MNTENDFRQKVIDVAEGMGAHVSHIESHQTSAGIPDLCIFLMEEDLWIELKVIKKRAVKLRPTQKRWHADRAQCGGMSWVLVLDPETDCILVVPGAVAAGLDSRAGSWRAVAGVSNVQELPQLLMKLIKRRKHGKRPPNRGGTPQGPRTTRPALPESGKDVVGDHWLLNKP